MDRLSLLFFESLTNKYQNKEIWNFLFCIWFLVVGWCNERNNYHFFFMSFKVCHPPHRDRRCHGIFCMIRSVILLGNNIHTILFYWSSIQNSKPMKCSFKWLKAYVSEEILNWHCLSLSLNADLCIHFYWLSRLRQASHRKMIQISALKLRLWLCHFKISSDTSGF